MSSSYYSIYFYFMQLISSIVMLYIFTGMFYYFIFGVSMYEENGEVKLAPRGTRKFFKLFSVICTIVYIYGLIKYYLPIHYKMARIFANVSLQIKGEVLSEYRGAISVVYFLMFTSLLIFYASKLLLCLSKGMKEKRNKYIKLYTTGYVYPLFLTAQLAVTIVGLQLFIGLLTGTYSNTIQYLWNSVVFMIFVFIMINGIFEFKTVIIYKNGEVTFADWTGNGLCMKSDVKIQKESDNLITVSLLNGRNYSVHCSPQKVDELFELCNRYLDDNK